LTLFFFVYQGLLCPPTRRTSRNGPGNGLVKADDDSDAPTDFLQGIGLLAVVVRSGGGVGEEESGKWGEGLGGS